MVLAPGSVETFPMQVAGISNPNHWATRSCQSMFAASLLLVRSFTQDASNLRQNSLSTDLHSANVKDRSINTLD